MSFNQRNADPNFEKLVRHGKLSMSASQMYDQNLGLPKGGEVNCV